MIEEADIQLRQTGLKVLEKQRLITETESKIIEAEAEQEDLE